jgi:hypothetical protein
MLRASPHHFPDRDKNPRRLAFLLENQRSGSSPTTPDGHWIGSREPSGEESQLIITALDVSPYSRFDCPQALTIKATD